jgi:hypothetical protein
VVSHGRYVVFKWRRSHPRQCSKRFCGSRNYGRSHCPRQHEAPIVTRSRPINRRNASRCQ